MKKRFLIAASAIVAVSAGVFAYLNSESKADDLFSANVEALASGEAILEVDCASSPDTDCKKRFRLADGTVRIVKVPYAVQVMYAR